MLNDTNTEMLVLYSSCILFVSEINTIPNIYMVRCVTVPL